MPITLIPIIPPPINIAALKGAIDGALDNMAGLVTADFHTTSASWDHQPGFATASRPWIRIISTADQIYAMLNKGTRPHLIMAKGRALVFQVPYRAKTAPRIIGSGGGGKGSTTVYTREVQHPGTAAREWDVTIAEKYQALIGPYMQDAITRVL